MSKSATKKKLGIPTYFEAKAMMCYCQGGKFNLNGKDFNKAWAIYCKGAPPRRRLQSGSSM